MPTLCHNFERQPLSKHITMAPKRKDRTSSKINSNKKKRKVQKFLSPENSKDSISKHTNNSKKSKNSSKYKTPSPRGPPISEVHVSNRNSGEEDDVTAATQVTTSGKKEHKKSTTVNEIVKYQSSSEAMKLTIKQFVCNDLFPKVKFVVNPNVTLAFHSLMDIKGHKTICGYVTKGCNLPPNVKPQEWWYSIARSTVAKKISTLRSDRTKAIKLRLFGKWSCCKVQMPVVLFTTLSACVSIMTQNTGDHTKETFL